MARLERIDPLALCVPAHVEQLPALLDLGAAACRQAGADDDDTLAVRLAIEEACINIIEHGYPPGPAGSIRLRIALVPAGLRITIEDEAPSFSPQAVAPPDLDAGWAERRIGGLGWHLIHRLMDRVEHQPLGARGNRLMLTKTLRRPTNQGEGR